MSLRLDRQYAAARQKKDLAAEIKHAKPQPSESADIVARKLNTLRKDKAEMMLKRLLEENPDNRSAVRELIVLYSRIEKVPFAEEMFRYALERRIADAGVHEAMISGYLCGNLRRSAGALLEKMASRGMLTAEACKKMIRAHAEAGVVEESRAVFDKALGTGIADSEMLSTMLSAYERASMPEKAIRLFEDMAVAGLLNAKMFNRMLASATQAGMADALVRIFDRMKEAGLANVEAYNTTISALRKLGRIEEAVKILRQAQQLGILDAKAFKSMEAEAAGKNLTAIERLLSEGKIDDAMELVAQMIEDYPENRKAMGGFIESCSRSGDILSAERLFSVALEKGIADAKIFETMIETYGKKRRISDAEKLIRQGQQLGILDEDSFHALLSEAEKADYGHAMRLLAQKKTEIAQALLIRIIQYNPKNRDAMQELLRIYAVNGDVSPAENIFSQARDMGIAGSRMYAMMIEMYSRKGMGKEVEALFKEAEAKGTISTRTCNTLLRSYINLRLLKEARPIFDKAVSIGVADADTFSLMLLIYVKAKMTDSALEIFHMAVKANLADRFSHTVMINELNKDRRLEEAKQISVNALKLGYMDAHSYNTMLSSCVQSRDLNGAELLYGFMREQELVSTHTFALMIQAYDAAGKLDKAEKMFMDALDQGKADVVVFTSMIRAYGFAGYTGKAQDLFDKALRLGITDPILFTALINVYGKTRHPRLALKIFSQAVDRKNANSVVYFEAIYSLLSNNKWDDARMVAKAGHDSETLNPKNITNQLSRIYRVGDYIGLIHVVEALPEGLVDLPILLLKADALRKSGRDETAISIADSVLSQADLEDEPRLRALTIKAYCLKDSGRKAEALPMFIDLYKKITRDSRHLPRAACGLVFCWEELSYDNSVSRVMVKRIYSDLKAAHINSKGSQKFDIERALAAIERSSQLEPQDDD